MWLLWPRYHTAHRNPRVVIGMSERTEATAIQNEV
jgi:hypothetical protein